MKHWQPMRRANGVKPVTDTHVQEAMRQTGQDEQTIRAALDFESSRSEYWINDIYQVQRRELEDDAGVVRAVHLNIRRRDGRPIFRDWRHFQRIKNELVGEECEGLEIYPAESRLSDTSNKYHLWVFTDPTYRIPFGMQERDVIDDMGTTKPGFRQRRF